MTLSTVARILFFFTVSFEPAVAYVQARTAAGRPVRWVSPSGARLPLAGLSLNNSGLSPKQVFDSIVRSLSRWKQSSAGGMTFDYWQGEDPGTYIPNSEYNGLSSFYFSSQKKSGTKLGSGVVAMTQTWYNADSGDLIETDIELNDLQYQFTVNPGDTTKLGRRVFIENILSHEIGHALGFSHNTGIQNTMLYNENPEQAILSCDEHVAMQAIYPSVTQNAVRGTIAGRIVGPDGNPVFGAHVQLIHEGRGVAVAQNVSEKDGSFSVSGLPFGRYRVMVEPFSTAAQNLPQYYSQARTSVCSGTDFSRTFSDQTIVLSGGIVQAGTIRVACDMNRVTPTQVTMDSESISIVGEFTSSDTQDVVIKNLSGDIDLNTLSYTLHSPLHVSMQLLDAYGNQQHVEATEVVQESASGYVNYNSRLRATDLPLGDYTVRLKAFVLPSSLYPLGGVGVDRNAFFVLTGHTGVLAEAGLSLHPRCAEADAFAEYRSPAGGPERRATEESRGGVGFCGTVRAKGEKLTSGMDPNSQQNKRDILAWFIPFAVMFGIGISHRVSLPRVVSQ